MTKQLKTESPDVQLLRARRAKLETHQHSVTDESPTSNTMEHEKQEITQDLLANEIMQANSQLQELAEFLADDTEHTESGITIGYVVTIRINEEKPASFLLVSKLGGQELSGKTTLSCETPVGKALIGRKAGDKFHVDLKDNRLEIEIIDAQWFV